MNHGFVCRLCSSILYEEESLCECPFNSYYPGMSLFADIRLRADWIVGRAPVEEFAGTSGDTGNGSGLWA